MITLTREGDRIALRFPYDAGLVAAVKGVPGRRWDPDRKVWTVPADAAEPLARVLTGQEVDADPQLLAEIGAHAQAQSQALAASRATDADIEIPVPDGLSYLPYQRAGIAFALDHPNVLFGDEMGLGKTIQAIGTVNADPTIRRVAVICPASLKLNWAREIARWSTGVAKIAIANGGGPRLELPEEVISRDATPRPWGEIFPGGGVEWLVINWDIATRWRDDLIAANLDALILDEAHYAKNEKAARTLAVLGGEIRKAGSRVTLTRIPARRTLALTGTPIPNRPVEAWTVAHALAPDVFPRYGSFVFRYCAAFNNGWGLDVSGASNLDELQAKLRGSIMVRRLKADVLTELPAKRRAVVELPADGSARRAIEAERSLYDARQGRLDALRAAVAQAKASEDPEAYRAAVAALEEGTKVLFDEMSAVRHQVALAKLPLVIDFVRDVLDGSSEKLIVFGHHLDLIGALSEAFPGAAVITGQTPIGARQQAVDRFQNDPECRLFIGNIRAAGVGLTLTAASHVVFAELDWVPGNVTQAEDRAHRIGQHDSVLVQHLVLEGSLDATMARTLIEKQAVLDAALDNEPAAIVAPVPAAPATPPAPAREPITVTEGWYVLDGQPHKVQRAVHGSGRLYGKVLTTDGIWQYAPGVMRDLALRGEPMTVEEAARWGKLYGFCAVCGRTLTDERSIDLGIGPVCIGRLTR